MGCTESNQIAEENPKPVTRNLTYSPSSRLFLMGEVSGNKHVLMEMDGKAEMTPLPLASSHQPKNHSSMIQISPHKFIITGGINESLTQISSETFIFNGKELTFQAVAPMEQPRYTHKSVFWKGSVCVMGGRYYGEDDKAILSSCERYGVEEGKWLPMPPMKVKRCTFMALIWKERLYVLGGYTGQCERSRVIQFWNWGDPQWQTAQAELNRGIQSTAMISTAPNQITIFGGNTNSGITDTVTSINLLSMTASSHPKLKYKRMLHKSFSLDEKIILFGGDSPFTIEEYDFGLWQSGEKQSKRLKFSPEQFQSFTHSEKTVQVQFSQQLREIVDSEYKDQIVYLFGTTQEPFILEFNISVPYAYFHPVPLSLNLHAFQGGICLKNKEFLFFGGISDSLQDVSAETHYYDHNKKQAKKLSPMNQSRYAFAFKQLGDYVYAIGGGTADEEGELVVLKHCERFSLKSRKWEPICEMPVGLIFPMVLVHKQQLYIFGGMTPTKGKFEGMLRYDEEKNQWNQLSFCFPFGLEGSSLFQLKQGQFLIFGGKTVNGNTKGIWQLTFSGDDSCVFVEKGQMTQGKSLHKIYKPRHQNFVVVFGGKNSPLTYHDLTDLKPIDSDILKGMKDMFEKKLSVVHHKSLENYLILSQVA